MNARLKAALAIWAARRTRAGGGRAYAAYSAVLVTVVAIIPLIRLLWINTTSAEGVAVLTSASAPSVVSFMTVALWAGALLVGRDLGPAMRPAFPLYALLASPVPRASVLGLPLLRAGLCVTASTAAIGGLIGASLLSHRLADPIIVIGFLAGAILIGVITTAAWLAGQAFPRAAFLVALCMALIATAGALIPVAQLFLPWAWFGLSYPGSEIADPLSFARLAALAIAVVAVVPLMLRALSLPRLLAQASRWETAMMFGSGLEFAAATATYQRHPHIGRTIRAARTRRTLPVTFLVRDTVGALRAPGRLLFGIGMLAAGGVLIILAMKPGTPAALLGVAAGLSWFGGLGPLTDGIRHAANVAGDYPIYGISDERLLALHAMFPLLAVVVVSLVTATFGAPLIGVGLFAALVPLVCLGVSSLMIRIGSALKGPLPATFLTPMPTPMGDLSIAVQLGWAFDGVILASLAGVTAVYATSAPFALMIVASVVIASGLIRWRNRT